MNPLIGWAGILRTGVQIYPSGYPPEPDRRVLFTVVVAAGGMPAWKFVSNRFLTMIENLAFGLNLSEYHTGLRAYSRRLLLAIPYRLNSDDFVFDQELVAQVVAVGNLRIGEIGVPTRYFDEASSVGFRRSVVYGMSTLRVVGRFLLHRTKIRRSAKLPSGRTES